MDNHHCGHRCCPRCRGHRGCFRRCFALSGHSPVCQSSHPKPVPPIPTAHCSFVHSRITMGPSPVLPPHRHHHHHDRHPFMNYWNCRLAHPCSMNHNHVTNQLPELSAISNTHTHPCYTPPPFVPSRYPQINPCCLAGTAPVVPVPLNLLNVTYTTDARSSTTVTEDEDDETDSYSSYCSCSYCCSSTSSSSGSGSTSNSQLAYSTNSRGRSSRNSGSTPADSSRNSLAVPSYRSDRSTSRTTRTGGLLPAPNSRSPCSSQQHSEHRSDRLSLIRLPFHDSSTNSNRRSRSPTLESPSTYNLHSPPNRSKPPTLNQTKSTKSTIQPAAKVYQRRILRRRTIGSEEANMAAYRQRQLVRNLQNQELTRRSYYHHELPTINQLIESAVPEVFMPPTLSVSPRYTFL